MFLEMKVTLEVTYGTTANHELQVIPKGPASPVIDCLPQLRSREMNEEQLSADILAMQRRIRGDKRQEHDAQPAAAREKKLKERAPGSLAGATDEESVKAAAKDGGKRLKLKDVQPSDLEAMDFAGVSPSLLAHPDGDSVNYTEREQKLIMAVYGRKSPKH